MDVNGVLVTFKVFYGILACFYHVFMSFRLFQTHLDMAFE